MVSVDIQQHVVLTASIGGTSTRVPFRDARVLAALKAARV